MLGMSKKKHSFTDTERESERVTESERRNWLNVYFAKERKTCEECSVRTVNLVVPGTVYILKFKDILTQTNS